MKIVNAACFRYCSFLLGGGGGLVRNTDKTSVIKYRERVITKYKIVGY